MFEPEIKAGNKSYHNISAYKLIGCFAALRPNQSGHWRVHLENKIFRDLTFEETSRELWEKEEKNCCDTKGHSQITEENQRELLKMSISTLYLILAHSIHSARTDRIYSFFFSWCDAGFYFHALSNLLSLLSGSFFFYAPTPV